MLATVQEARRRGGLNHAEDYRLFRVTDEAELDDMVEEDLLLAESYLLGEVDPLYYTGSPTLDLALDARFKRCECLMAMYFLTLPLKIRKVEGTHWSVDQEGSERFAELIDVEYLAMVEVLTKPYLIVATAGEAGYGYPVMMASNPVDRSSVPVVDVLIQDILDEANGLIGATSL